MHDPRPCLKAGQRLQRREWDGETVLYNDLSGDTHLLNDAALALLLALQQAPQSRQQLAELLGEPGPDLDAVDALLGELEALSLIEYTPC
jgi:PqqD family protein of HPr-rel-A system